MRLERRRGRGDVEIVVVEVGAVDAVGELQVAAVGAELDGEREALLGGVGAPASACWRAASARGRARSGSPPGRCGRSSAFLSLRQGAAGRARTAGRRRAAAGTALHSGTPKPSTHASLIQAGAGRFNRAGSAGCEAAPAGASRRAIGASSRGPAPPAGRRRPGCGRCEAGGEARAPDRGDLGGGDRRRRRPGRVRVGQLQEAPGSASRGRSTSARLPARWAATRAWRSAGDIRKRPPSSAIGRRAGQHPGDEARRRPGAPGRRRRRGRLRHLPEEQRLAPVHRDVLRRDRRQAGAVDRGAGRRQQVADDVVRPGVAVERDVHPARPEHRLELRQPRGVVEVVVVVVVDVAVDQSFDRLGVDALLQEVLAAQEDDQVRLEVPGRGGVERREVAGPLVQPLGEPLGRDQQPRARGSRRRGRRPPPAPRARSPRGSGGASR